MSTVTYFNPPYIRGYVTVETVFGYQCHKCMQLRQEEHGMQPIECTCKKRYYCSQACQISDATEHRPFCFDAMSTIQALEKLRRDTIALAYDRLHKAQLIDRAVEHMLADWILICRNSNGTRVFPQDPFTPDNWKEFFRKGAYFHLRCDICQADFYRWTSLAASCVRPLPELPAEQLEKIYCECNAFHPTIVFGYTVVDTPIHNALGLPSIPYVITVVHKIPMVIACRGLDRARALTATL